MLKAEHVITERRIFYYTYNLSCVLLKHITNKRNVFEIKKFLTTIFEIVLKTVGGLRKIHYLCKQETCEAAHTRPLMQTS